MPYEKNQPLSPETSELLAEQFRLLSEPLRVRILHVLKAGEKSVGEVVEALEAHQPTVSKQLKLLHEAGLLSRRQEGTTVHYHIADPVVFQLCALVCSSLEERTRTRAASRLELLRAD